MSEFDFSKVVVPTRITKEWLLKQVDSHTIMYYYHGPFKLNKAVCSYFDKGDSNPSTTFYIGQNGQVTYYDFRSGEKLDAISFVMKLYNLSFRDALYRIASDFSLINGIPGVVPQKVILEAQMEEKEAKKETLIQFQPTRWNPDNLQYWRKYEITQEELVRDEVYPINRAFLNHVELNFPENDVNKFAYPIKNVGVKLYCPNNPNIKHLTNIPLSVPFGLDSLPYTSDKVIITKSKKDRLIMLKYFTDVIATQNESTASLPEEIQTMLKRRYSHRIVVFDNDLTGKENSMKLTANGFSHFNIPNEEYERYRIKDPSDYVEAYSLIAFEELLKTKNLL